VWVGYDKPRSLGKDETGSRVAVPIWTAFMKEALAGKPVEDFPIPEGVVVVPVDLSAAGTCAKPVTMAFLAGTEPKNTCGPARSSGPRPDAAPPSPLTPAPPAPAPTLPPAEASPDPSPPTAAATPPALPKPRGESP
jgi:penicillin-binding protein 1A